MFKTGARRNRGGPALLQQRRGHWTLRIASLFELWCDKFLDSGKDIYNRTLGLSKGIKIPHYISADKQNDWAPISKEIVAERDFPIRKWILRSGGAKEIYDVIVGGTIRYETDIGPFLVKIHSTECLNYEAEAAGLNAILDTKTIRVPKQLKVGSLPVKGSYIIMEFIKFAPPRPHSEMELGRKLAQMHKVSASDKGFGFCMDNKIGITMQRNTWSQDWASFYRDHRLGYQLELARQQFNDVEVYSLGQRLLDKLPSLLSGLDIKPCLLHGNIWSGNVKYDSRGSPVVFDPACYYGHNEAEFGKHWYGEFGDDFYDAYFKILPKQVGFEERRPLYELYHYLNYCNTFGRFLDVSRQRSTCMSIMNNYI